MLDLQSLVDIADKLGLIQAVKNKLLRQPNAAADSLVAVLGELSKIYGACDAELLRYLSLSFDPAEKNAEERAVLLTLESGQLRTRTAEARGHCHKIWNIYRRDLQRWFINVLAPDGDQENGGVVPASRLRRFAKSELAIRELTDWLTSRAQETLDLVDAGKQDEANQRIKVARKEVLPARQ